MGPRVRSLPEVYRFVVGSVQSSVSFLRECSAAIQHIKESSSGAVIICKNGVSVTCGDCNNVKMIVCGE